MADADKVRALAVSFTVAVATAGRIAFELDRTVADINEHLERRQDVGQGVLVERRDRIAPFDGEDRRSG